MPTTVSAEHKTLSSPDEERVFEKGRVDLVNIGGGTVGRLTLEPGWRWSVHVKPIAGTELCEAPHFQYHASGVLRIQMADGSEFDARTGDITALALGPRRMGDRRRAGRAHRLERREQLRKGLITAP